MSKHKCTCPDCFANINGECKLRATQVFNIGCQHYIKPVPEYVDFAEAWKAYEEGKTIQSVIKSNPFDTYKKSEDTNRGIFTDEIRGKWLILEDE